MLRGEMKTFFPGDECRRVKPKSFCVVTSRVCIAEDTSELHFVDLPAASTARLQARTVRTSAKPVAALLQRITAQFDFVRELRVAATIFTESNRLGPQAEGSNLKRQAPESSCAVTSRPCTTSRRRQRMKRSALRRCSSFESSAAYGARRRQMRRPSSARSIG